MRLPGICCSLPPKCCKLPVAVVLGSTFVLGELYGLLVSCSIAVLTVPHASLLLVYSETKSTFAAADLSSDVCSCIHSLCKVRLL